jgi:hypothetical protein
MVNTPLFEMNFQQLKEELNRLRELVSRESSEKNPDFDIIAPQKRLISRIEGLLEIKDPEIEGKALEIMKNSDPVDYVIEIYNRLHVGDTNLGKIMLISIASLSAVTTDGTQPKLSGEPGKGKTHAATSMFHLIPDVGYKLEGSLSSKSLFYDPDLIPGTIIFSDDVRISDDLEDTLKRAMSNFQRPTIHKTLDKQSRPRTLTIPPRFVFWMTSVSSPFSSELNSRLYDINVDERPEADQAVTEQRKKRARRGDEELPIDEDVKICRAIIHTVRCRIFHVRIPYADHIQWRDSRDRRNFNRFLDLIQGLAILRFMQRPTVEQGGTHTIMANIQDFDDAKTLYDDTSKTQITKVTDAERLLAVWLAGRGPKTINEIVNEYRKPDETQYRYNSIRKLVKGNDGKGGLLDKVPGMTLSYVNRVESYELRSFNAGAVGSIVSLSPEAYEEFS